MSPDCDREMMKYKDLNGDGKIDDYDHCHQQYSTPARNLLRVFIGAEL